MKQDVDSIAVMGIPPDPYVVGSKRVQYATCLNHENLRYVLDFQRLIRVFVMH